MHAHTCTRAHTYTHTYTHTHTHTHTRTEEILSPLGDEDEDRAGSDVHSCDIEDSLPAVNAQQISNSYFVNLDVGVLEVRLCCVVYLCESAVNVQWIRRTAAL